MKQPATDSVWIPHPIGTAARFGILLKRECRLRFRQPAAFVYTLGFFVLVVVLQQVIAAPLLPAEHAAVLAVPTVWMASLLALGISMGSMWREWESHGLLLQHVHAPGWGYPGVCAYAAAEMVYTGLPVWGCAALFCTAYQSSWYAAAWSMLALALAIPGLYYLGLFASALLISVPQSAVFVVLLVLPWYIPVLIWGCGVERLLLFGLSPEGPCALLAAFSLICCVLCPWGILHALRWGVQ